MKSKYSLLIVLFIVVGCGFGQSRMRAETAWNHYRSAFKTESYQEALSLYSNAFFKKTPRKKWAKVIKRNRKKLGVPKTDSTMKWGVKNKVGLVGSGTYVTLVKKVTYAKGKTREIMTLFMSSAGSKAIILGHRILPPRK